MRITTHKPVSEMNNSELAFNCCTLENGWAYYRDFETSLDANEFCMELLEHFGELPEEFSGDEYDPDEFSTYMFEALQNGYDDNTGIVAVVYRLIVTAAALREKLLRYEDAFDKE